MKACIIGLGVFGRSLALTLAELGVEVVALDLSETLVAAIKDEMSVAAVADASNPEALAMFPMAEMDVVVVGIGQDFEASLQATAHAQELGAKRVITRVLSPVHERLLKLMKVERAVVPEEVAAKTLGKSLVLEGVTGLYELDAKYSIVELPVPESLIGVKPRQSDVLESEGLQLVTVRRPLKGLLGLLPKEAGGIVPVVGAVPENFTFEKGDILVVFGKEKAVKALLQA